jgi:hypothetical protein
LCGSAIFLFRIGGVSPRFLLVEGLGGDKEYLVLQSYESFEYRGLSEASI